MAFDLFDTVRIVEKDIVGDVVEVVNGKDGKPYYLVQSDEEASNDNEVLIPGSCPIYECLEDELERVSET